MEFMALSMALAIDFAAVPVLLLLGAWYGFGLVWFGLVRFGLACPDSGEEFGMLLIKRLPDSLWIHKLLCTNAKVVQGSGCSATCCGLVTASPPVSSLPGPSCADRSSLINELAVRNRQRLIRAMTILGNRIKNRMEQRMQVLGHCNFSPLKY